MCGLRELDRTPALIAVAARMLLLVETMPMPLLRARARRSEGFSLVETLTALTVLLLGATALAQTIVMSAGANVRARTLTRATVFAAEKMDELRAAAFGFDALGAPLTDAALTRSPPASLDADLEGYVDRPAEAFVRRWSISDATVGARELKIVQVLVVGPGGVRVVLASARARTG